MGHLALCHWLMYPCIFHHISLLPVCPVISTISSIGYWFFAMLPCENDSRLLPQKSYLCCCDNGPFTPSLAGIQRSVCIVSTTDAAWTRLPRLPYVCLRSYWGWKFGDSIQTTQRAGVPKSPSSRSTIRVSVWHHFETRCTHTLFDIATDCFT